MPKWLSEAGYMLLTPQDAAIGPVESKLRQFRSLQAGWHYGEGKAIDPASLERALDLYQAAIRLAPYEMDAFPGLNGEVVLTVYREDRCLEFTLEPNGTVTFSYEQGDQEVSYVEGLSLEQARDRIKEFRQSWLGSDSFTVNTTTGESTDSEVSLSRITGTPLGSQSLVWTASMRPEPLSASTSDDTTLLSRMSRLFSGVSVQRYCQPVTD
jgi:hypothetical protein